ncbi:MAG: glycosyltransferase family 4 protein [Proteobacteria bacterium]|nr:glycosyltransferase family 4 protein [Pseudomonadota bacterium]
MSGKMVVLVVAKMVFPARLDPGHKDVRTFEALSRYVDQIHLLVQSPDGRSREIRRGRVHYHLIGRAGPRWLDHVRFISRAVIRGRRLIRRHGVDVIDASEPIGGGVAATLLSRLTGVPAAAELQGELLALSPRDFSRFRIWRTRAITRLILGRARAVRCVAGRIRDQALAAGVAAHKLLVVPSRVDTGFFDPARWSERGRELRAEWGWTNNPVVVFIGRLVAHKAVDDILAAWPRVMRGFPEARLLLVGDGPLVDELGRQAERLELGNSVRFYGRAEFDQVPGLLAAGDVFLSPSLDEGLPRTLLEAMAMGLPAVVTDVGGNPEVVRPGETGFLLPPRRPDLIADRVGRLLEDGDLRQRMGRAGRRRVVEGYGFEAGIESFYRFLQAAAR